MQTVLLVLLTLVGLLLIAVVLLQAGKGGGLSASFGGTSSSTESFLGGRQAATLLTKASWVLGGTFLFLSLTLAILSVRARAPRSVLESEIQTRPVPVAPSPLVPGEGGQEVPTPLQPVEEPQPSPPSTPPNEGNPENP
jgi:preprotein translocase subunit SecG